jgi:hypothetical protein
MRLTAFQGHLLTLADLTKTDLSDGLAQNWWRKYRHIDEALFVAAIDRAGDECTFWPSHKEFGACLDAVMTPEERGIQEGIRLLRSWVAAGVTPHVGSLAEYQAVRTALGLPPAGDDQLHRCALRLAERETGPASEVLTAMRYGPVLARLLGTEHPALLAGPR